MASQDHISTSSSLNGSFSHRRRRSSANFQSAPQHLNVHNANNNPPRTGSTTLAPIPGMPSRARLDHHGEQLLTTIPGTPNPSMDHSRSTSPQEDAGWANPGLSVQYSDHSGRASPANGFRPANGGTGWDLPRKKAVLNGGAYPNKDGFLQKRFRKVSESLPRFFLMSEEDKIGIKEKPGKSRRCLPNRNSRIGRALSGLDQFYQRRKKLVLGILTCIIMWIMFYTTRKFSTLHHPSPRSFANLDSTSLLLAQSTITWWRQEIRFNTGSQPRWWCHGVERTKRVGD